MAFRMLRSLRADTRGVTALEYGLIAALIAIAIISSVGNVGTALSATFVKLNTTLTTANSHK